jgi:hypothetical protein
MASRGSKKEAMLEAFWITFATKGVPGTERPETRQTLACLCQKDIRGVPRDPRNIKETLREPLFPEVPKKPPQKVPQTPKMTSQRAPKGTQDDQKGRQEAKMRETKTQTEKRDEKETGCHRFWGRPAECAGVLGRKKEGAERRLRIALGHRSLGG